MDPHALHECFAATLSADQQLRQQAEAQLRQAERSLGFLGACLDILGSNGVNPAIKTAAAVFFKNRIVRYWRPYKNDSDAVDDDEKPYIRERLLTALVDADHRLRRQLIPVLETIVAHDYPKQWPSLVEQALQLLYSQNLESAYTGLLCFAKVCSSYRWTTNEERPQLDILINQHFQTLLTVADTLLKQESQEAGEMTVLVLKIYKYVTYHDLPAPLQSLQAIQDWGNIHVAVINKPLPEEVMELQINDRKLHPWVKTKKWACANLFRLFDRYGSQSLSKKFSYDSFKSVYTENFVPQLLSLYLSQVDQWCSNRLWMSEEQLFYVLNFLEKSIIEKHTWNLLKPHIELLVSHFIFPLLCPSDETLDQFENDPEDYIHTKLDIFDDNNASDLAAISLLMTLTRKKKKTTLEPILQFAFGQLNELKDPTTQSIQEAKRLEGALRLIGSLVDHFVNEKSPYYPQMEGLLQQFIYPHFNSRYAFIKARTCEIASKFADIPLQQEASLGALYRGILASFEDANLPVQLEAALALQSFVKIPQFQEALSTVIMPTMQKLLQLSNTIDAEAISGVMQELVEVFSEQLQPFGVDLMTNLVNQFMKLAQELNEASKVDADEFDGNFDDFTDKQMAALGLLNTMITVLLSFESSTEIVFKLEETFYPAVEYVFVQGQEDFFREVSELIENSTFLTRQISPACWKAFELMMQSLTNTVAIMYLEDMMPALNNFLCFGAEQIKSNPEYIEAFLALFKRVMSDEDNSPDDYAYGAEVGQKVILTLGSGAQPFVEEMLSITINNIVSATDLSNTFAINMLNVIVAGFVYHAHASLTTLANGNFILPLFNLWFQYIPKMTRVFDMKLSALGLLSLINLSINELNALQINTVSPQFGLQLALLMDKLPSAISDLEKRRKEFDGNEDAGEYIEYEDAEEWENEDADEDGEGGATDDYMEFLQQEAEKLKSSGFYDIADDDLPEDPLAHDILEGVNVFNACKEVLMACQSDVQKNQLIFSGLTSDQQSTLQDIIQL
jgi:hypothetical protein